MKKHDTRTVQVNTDVYIHFDEYKSAEVECRLDLPSREYVTLRLDMGVYIYIYHPDTLKNLIDTCRDTFREWNGESKSESE